MLADGVINMVVAPEVSSIDPSASIVINNLTIPGIQTRRAKTVVELRDGESFALAGLIRKDFQDTIRQVPLLGSLPIIGSLFRSTGFQHEESELVIIVTPRLVRPVPAGALKVPTDRVGPPNEADLLINGRTDTGVSQVPRGLIPPGRLRRRHHPVEWRRRSPVDLKRIMAMFSSPRLSVLVVALTALGACSTTNSHIGDEDAFMGEAVKYNAALQTINPTPAYPAASAQAGDSGALGAEAVKRYRRDAVKPVETMGTTGGGGASTSSGPK